MHNIEQIVEDIVRSVMPNDITHGLDHVLRVRALAHRIAKELMSQGISVDLEVLDLAVLLHDIGRIQGDEDHAARSADIARKILKSLGYPDDKIDRVIHAILAHSFSSNVKPNSIEAMILSDADKLDALGAIGIARVFAYSGRKNRDLDNSIRHFEEKILKLKDLMYTEPAKRIAEERHSFVVQFLQRLREEINALK